MVFYKYSIYMNYPREDEKFSFAVVQKVVRLEVGNQMFSLVVFFDSFIFYKFELFTLFIDSLFIENGRVVPNENPRRSSTVSN